MSQPTHAVVLGASLAGMLAASALAPHVDTVTVIERDTLPDGPQTRTGVPQARHTHVLMHGGARAIDALLPGTMDRLVQAGAHRHGMPDGVVTLSPQGWLERFPGTRIAVTCSRALLDWVVRQQALREERVTVLQRTEVDGLVGTATQVTGVRIRDRASTEVRELPADFVVDATGRGSRSVQWLTGLGLPEVAEEVVDSGQAYATRVYRAHPEAQSGFPMINVQAAPGTGHPGCGATLLPIEEGRWMVTLGGTRGGEPPTDEEGFADFIRNAVRHPLVADIVADAEPIGPIVGSRSSVNRRRRFEGLSSWPAGFVVLGDAATTFNPIYGHGMSVAARGAVALRDGVGKYGVAGSAARRIQRAIGRTADDAWKIATTQDVLYPQAIGPRVGVVARFQRAYVNRIIKTATRQPAVSAALVDAFTLATSFMVLAKPRILLRALRGPGKPLLSEPPLSTREHRVVQEPAPLAEPATDPDLVTPEQR